MSRLQGLPANRCKEHPVQPEVVRGYPGDLQMPAMGRIEASTKQSDPWRSHLLHGNQARPRAEFAGGG